MFCQNCGNQLEEGSKFCPVCGAKVLETASQDPVPAQPAAEFPAPSASDRTVSIFEDSQEGFAQDLTPPVMPSAAPSPDQTVSIFQESKESFAQEIPEPAVPSAVPASDQTVSIFQEAQEEPTVQLPVTQPPVQPAPVQPPVIPQQPVVPQPAAPAPVVQQPVVQPPVYQQPAPIPQPVPAAAPVYQQGAPAVPVQQNPYYAPPVVQQAPVYAPPAGQAPEYYPPVQPVQPVPEYYMPPQNIPAAQVPAAAAVYPAEQPQKEKRRWPVASWLLCLLAAIAAGIGAGIMTYAHLIMYNRTFFSELLGGRPSNYRLALTLEVIVTVLPFLIAMILFICPTRKVPVLTALPWTFYLIGVILNAVAMQGRAPYWFAEIVYSVYPAFMGIIMLMWWLLVLIRPIGKAYKIIFTVISLLLMAYLLAFWIVQLFNMGRYGAYQYYDALSWVMIALANLLMTVGYCVAGFAVSRKRKK